MRTVALWMLQPPTVLMPCLKCCGQSKVDGYKHRIDVFEARMDVATEDSSTMCEHYAGTFKEGGRPKQTVGRPPRISPHCCIQHNYEDCSIFSR